MDAKGLETLLVVALVAALAPIIVAALPGPRIPQVVVLIFAGILIGPNGLGLADTASIKLLANVGLGFLFLLAGYELDPRLLREQAGKEEKLDAVGYGFFIPVFFVVSGMTLDVRAIAQAPLRLLAFFLLLLVVRGLPSLLIDLAGLRGGGAAAPGRPADCQPGAGRAAAADNVGNRACWHSMRSQRSPRLGVAIRGGDAKYGARSTAIAGPSCRKSATTWPRPPVPTSRTSTRHPGITFG